MAGVFLFCKLFNQIIILIGGFFIGSVFIFQFTEVTIKIGGSVNNKLFGNGDLFLSVI